MIGLIDAITKMTDQLTLNYTQGKVINEFLIDLILYLQINQQDQHQ